MRLNAQVTRVRRINALAEERDLLLYYVLSHIPQDRILLPDYPGHPVMFTARLQQLPLQQIDVRTVLKSLREGARTVTP